jgi:hypothetical protein
MGNIIDDLAVDFYDEEGVTGDHRYHHAVSLTGDCAPFCVSAPV